MSSGSKNRVMGVDGPRRSILFNSLLGFGVEGEGKNKNKTQMGIV